MNRYVIINLEQKSNEDSFLFWKDEGRGYTADINEAGLFEKPINNGDNFSIFKDILIKNFKQLTIVKGKFSELVKLKND